MFISIFEVITGLRFSSLSIDAFWYLYVSFLHYTQWYQPKAKVVYSSSPWFMPLSSISYNMNQLKFN